MGSWRNLESCGDFGWLDSPHLAWYSSKFEHMGNVTLLDGYVVSNIIYWANYIELVKEGNYHGRGRDYNTKCATWKEILCTLWQQMMKDSMESMTNSDLIAEIWKIWHERNKNSHQ